MLLGFVCGRKALMVCKAPLKNCMQLLCIAVGNVPAEVLGLAFNVLAVYKLYASLLLAVALYTRTAG